MHGDGDCSEDQDLHHYPQKDTHRTLADRPQGGELVGHQCKVQEDWDDSQCNVENSLVKCNQKVDSNVAITEFKKTGEDIQCNVESPHVELDLRRQTRAVCACWPQHQV